MTAKQYLKQHVVLTSRMQRLQEAIEEARSAAMYSGINLDDMPRSASPRNSTEDRLMRLVSLEEDLRKTILADQEKIFEIENTIDQVENEAAAQILHLRYIKGLPFENYYGNDVVSETNYSTPHVYTLHREGLKEVQKIIDEKYC